jgi:hypothetical protein
MIQEAKFSYIILDGGGNVVCLVPNDMTEKSKNVAHRIDKYLTGIGDEEKLAGLLERFIWRLPPKPPIRFGKLLQEAKELGIRMKGEIK